MNAMITTVSAVPPPSVRMAPRLLRFAYMKLVPSAVSLPISGVYNTRLRLRHASTNFESISAAEIDVTAVGQQRQQEHNEASDAQADGDDENRNAVRVRSL